MGLFKRGHEPYGFITANVPIVRRKKKKGYDYAILTPLEFVVDLTGFGYFFTNNAEVCHIT